MKLGPGDRDPGMCKTNKPWVVLLLEISVARARVGCVFAYEAKINACWD